MVHLILICYCVIIVRLCLVARDDVEWDIEQEQLAEAKVRENSTTMMGSQDKGHKECVEDGESVCGGEL